MLYVCVFTSCLRGLMMSGGQCLGVDGGAGVRVNGRGMLGGLINLNHTGHIRSMLGGERGVSEGLYPGVESCTVSPPSSC